MEFGTPEIKPESTKVEHLYEATFEGRTRSSSLMEIIQFKKITKSNTLETFWGFESNSTSTIEAGIPLIFKVTKRQCQSIAHSANPSEMLQRKLNVHYPLPLQTFQSGLSVFRRTSPM